jgi:putative transposase
LGRWGGKVDIVVRKECLVLIQTAVDTGASRTAACELLGLSIRTLQRWRKDPDQGDRRSGPVSPVLHSLTDTEKQKIIDVSNSPLYRDLSPWQIVPKLADSGEFLGSESSFYRILKKERLLNHRSRCKPPENKRPKDLIANAPNQVWSWDITYLKSPILGKYYFLYLVMDVFSRMVVGWTLEEKESSEISSVLISELYIKYNITKDTLTLHADNGGPMKGATMLVTLQKLHVLPSFSRPSVSNDNPYSESLFKTLKYRPSYPDGAFASFEEAHTWVTKFVAWYNEEHLHSEIQFVTPRSRHESLDVQILQNRHIVYQYAKQQNPFRWSRATRNWSPITEVRLNPLKKDGTSHNKQEQVGARLLAVDPGDPVKWPTSKDALDRVPPVARQSATEEFFHKYFPKSDPW